MVVVSSLKLQTALPGSFGDAGGQEVPAPCGATLLEAVAPWIQRGGAEASVRCLAVLDGDREKLT